MKDTVAVSLGLIAMAGSALAGQNIGVNAKATVRVPTGGQEIVPFSYAVTASSQRQTFTAGDAKCVIVPTVLDGGEVIIHAFITVHAKRGADQTSEVQVTTRNGQIAEFNAGNVVFAFSILPHQ